MNIKAMISTLLAVGLFTGIASALSVEEENMLSNAIIDSAASVANEGFDVDYNTEDAFDDLEITEYINDSEKIVFSFDCKAKNFPYHSWESVKLGEYKIGTYSIGELFVFNKADNEMLNIKSAYETGLVGDSDLEYIYCNCAYKGDSTLAFPDYETNDSVNDVIMSQANDVYNAKFNENINSGTFENLEVRTYYSDESIKIFKFRSSSNIVRDGWHFWRLGNYYFDMTGGGEFYAYDKANNNLMFIDDAYNEGIISDSVLEEIAESMLRNRLNKATVTYLGTEPIAPGTETPSDIGEETNGDIQTDTDIGIDTDTATDTEPELLQGDVNNDNTVDILDVVLIRDYIVGNSSFGGEELERADMNSDKSVDIVDVVIVRNMIVSV